MKLSHMWSWTKLLVSFFSLQLLIQVISAVVGIIIVRTVDKHEYAFYTITNAFLASASNLADCGITAALSAIGGKLWSNPSAFGSLLNTAFGIRKRFTAVIMAGILLTLPFMLFRNGAGAFKISSLSVVLIVSILFQFASSIYGVVPQLRADYKVLQKVALYTALLRLATLGLAWLTVLDALTALLINCIGFGFQMILYRWYAKTQVEMDAKPDAGMRRSIFTIIRKQIPYEVYGVLSGQISVFLLTIFGSNTKVADVGALGRIAMIFTAMAGVLTNVLLPRFARCQEKDRLSRLFWRILLIYFAAVSSVLVLAWFFPNQIILLLGHQYSNLGPDCALAVAVAVSGTMLGAVWGMNSSRGWIIPAWIGLSVGVSAQIIGILVFNIRTVHGVLLMSLCTNCAGLAVNLLASMRFLHRAKKGIEEHAFHYTPQAG